MPVTDVRKDTTNLTLTIVATFEPPVERVWQIWADPRQLERWWGPPVYPATVTEHDLRPGGRVRYHMTGPEGDRHHGFWKVRAVDPPRSFEIEDFFADESGAEVPGLPATKMRVTLAATATGGTEMTAVSTWSSLEAMEQNFAMGVLEGTILAMSQITPLLAA